MRKIIKLAEDVKTALELNNISLAWGLTDKLLNEAKVINAKQEEEKEFKEVLKKSGLGGVGYERD